MGSRRVGGQRSNVQVVRYRLYLVLVGCVSLMTALACTLAALAMAQNVQTYITSLRQPAGANWTRFGFDSSATRNNPVETAISASTVSRLRLKWRARLGETADSTPTYLRGLRFPDGTMRDALYLTTKAGSLVAVDASGGTVLWRWANPIGDPNKPTTSSPYADPTQGIVYSYGLDGKVRRYDAVTGKETPGGGWPVTVTTMPTSEKGSAALNAAEGYLYVTTASFGGDAPPYQGHVVAIDLASGATHVFNALCSTARHLLAPGECRDNGSGVWARPGVVFDPVTGNIFFATGNGPYTADDGGDNWGESVVELTPDATRVVDSYTPTEPNALHEQDLDLGSSDPALLPPVPGSRAPHLAIQAGKEGTLRLLNRQDLSGQDGSGHVGGELQTIDAPKHCPVLTQPAVWTDPQSGAVWSFVANGCAVGGYRVNVSKNGDPTIQLMWTAPQGATSPVVAGGVVFAATTGDKEILALDPRTGHVLWSSANAQSGGTIGYTHWESPIVLNGRLYCTDENGDLLAYGV
jgi:outer membrane protein assembly factor BamB